MKNVILLLNCALLILGCTQKKESSIQQNENMPDNHLYLLIGTYTEGSSTGIYVYDFDAETADTKYVSDIKDVSNPSYLTVSADEQFVYSVNEDEDGAASAFSFDKKTGVLEKLNTEKTGGAHPCYINVDKERRFAVTANYNGGSLSVFPIAKDGNLNPVSQYLDMNYSERSTIEPVSHIHTALFSPDNQYLFVTDLGKDKIYWFYFEDDNGNVVVVQDANKTTELERGSGPRHLAFHPNGKFLYSINELAGTVTAFDYKENGLSAIQYIASDITPSIGDKGSADIHLSPDGRFLYASNRLKADGIAIFSVNQKDGMLTKVGYQETGIHPRNFILTPDGRFLLVANRNSNNIQIFSIDKETGLLKDTGKTVEIDMPVCLKWISKA